MFPLTGIDDVLSILHRAGSYNKPTFIPLGSGPSVQIDLKCRLEISGWLQSAVSTFLFSTSASPIIAGWHESRL